MGLDNDEKALIMAAAVLGTILVTVMAFAILYRSFLSSYATAYNKQMALLHNATAATTPNPAYKDPAPIRTSPSPVMNYAHPLPDSPPGSPTARGSKPNVQIKLSEPEITPMVSVKTETQKNAPAASPVESPSASPNRRSVTWGDTVEVPAATSGASSWGVDVNANNEFFSADEQAKIWEELRMAEAQASSGGPSGADIAKGQASKIAAAVADDDEDTKFGFEEEDVKPTGPDYIITGGADYISPDTLQPTGEVFDPTQTKTATVKQANMKMNVTNEWWK